MKAWDALFDIKEFRFEEVMRAAVLPGLTRTGTTDTDLRDSNRTIEALATICRLAGKTTKPDQPLPLGRLGSDRAFFNLSRLEVPCRSGCRANRLGAGAPGLLRARLGRRGLRRGHRRRDGRGGRTHGHQVSRISRSVRRVLVGDRRPRGRRPSIEPRVEPDEGEVDLEDDTDEALETTVNDRWRNFFAWLGVSRGLRLVHFHDVDDSGTGWTSTKGLPLPGGWAFAGLDETWADYRADIESALSDPRWESTDHYLYQVHNLDRLDEIAAVARLKDNDVAERLLAHLVRNWATYARHTQAEAGAGRRREVAFIAHGTAPGDDRGTRQRRTRPLAVPTAAPRDLSHQPRASSTRPNLAPIRGTGPPARAKRPGRRRVPPRPKAAD